VITIRPYRPEDCAACDAVFYRAVREGAAGFYDLAQRMDWAPDDEDDDREDKLLTQACWVSEEAGRITGFMSLMPDGHLDMAFVLPEVMGKGHAAALYDVLVAHARKAGLARLTVDASEYSRRFLTRRGWVLDRVEVLNCDSGVQFDRNHMSLVLQAGPR
jgi:putative acetyltransferase